MPVLIIQSLEYYKKPLRFSKVFVLPVHSERTLYNTSVCTLSYNNYYLSWLCHVRVKTMVLRRSNIYACLSITCDSIHCDERSTSIDGKNNYHAELRAVELSTLLLLSNVLSVACNIQSNVFSFLILICNSVAATQLLSKHMSKLLSALPTNSLS